MDKKRELLQKLKALADRGVGGEKINAQRKLDEYMRKHGYTLEDLDEQQKISFETKCSSEEEKTLLVQIIYKVTNEKGGIYGFTWRRSGRTCKNLVGYDVTRAQKIEIDFLFDFYKRLYQKERKLFLQAFIQKHELFGSLKDGEKPQEMPNDERLRLAFMQRGMSDEQPLRQITGGQEYAKT